MEVLVKGDGAVEGLALGHDALQVPAGQVPAAKVSQVPERREAGENKLGAGAVQVGAAAAVLGQQVQLLQLGQGVYGEDFL